MSKKSLLSAEFFNVTFLSYLYNTSITVKNVLKYIKKILTQYIFLMFRKN